MKGSTLTSVVVVVGWMALTGSEWAWALGFVVWHGAVAGAVIGLLVGILLTSLFTEASEQKDLTGAGATGCGLILVGLLVVLPVIGAIVGLVRLVFW